VRDGRCGESDEGCINHPFQAARRLAFQLLILPHHPAMLFFRQTFSPIARTCLLLLGPASSTRVLYPQNPPASLRGQSSPLRPSVNRTSVDVLCHIMEIRVEYLESQRSANLHSTHGKPSLPNDASELVCETTLPNGQSDVALWIYKMNNLPQSIRNKLTEDSQTHDWIHISDVLR
jgi:hypothetical protein